MRQTAQDANVSLLNSSAVIVWVLFSLQCFRHKKIVYKKMERAQPSVKIDIVIRIGGKILLTGF